MTGLVVVSLIFGVLGALLSAVAGVSLYRGRTRETEPGLFSVPTGDRMAFALTIAASGFTGLAVIASAMAVLVV